MKKPANNLEEKKNGLERKVPLILEDAQGQCSFFAGGFPFQDGKEGSLFRPMGVDLDRAFVSFEPDQRLSEMYISGDKDWDGFNLCLARLRKARLALRALYAWYEALVNDDFHSLTLGMNTHQIFFNSQLIYLIALTDDKEDNLGHSQFVAAYSLLLAKAMGIEDDNFILNLQRGALLHDIGKIGLPPLDSL
jgi:hypothetical protein